MVLNVVVSGNRPIKFFEAVKRVLNEKKIAIFVPSMRGGGAERQMVNLAKGFGARGVSVDLVLTKAEGPYLKGVTRSVNIVDLGASRVMFCMPALIRYLNHEQPFAMLSAMNHANVVALLAHRLSRVSIRMVVSERNTPSIDSANAPTNRGRFLPLFMRFFYPWADAIIAVSGGVADDLSECTGLPRERIRVIYNPVVEPELFELAKEPVEHPWFRAGEPPVVLSAGRLTAQKDYPTLLRAFSLVIRARPMRLVILGEGEERAGLEAMVRDLGLEDVVSLPGFSKNPYAYMSKAIVFVLSSAWEGFGNVLVEAMAVGTPVVTTDCPNGPAEILENGKYGRLVPVGNAEALAERILAALDGSTNSEVLRLRAKDFSYDDIADQYLEILHGGD